jgi:hypothetical protein
VIDLESAYVKTFVDNDLLAKLDNKSLTNKKNIADGIPAATGDEKMEYTCPDMAPGYTGIVYNKETCPIKITKFSGLVTTSIFFIIIFLHSFYIFYDLMYLLLFTAGSILIFCMLLYTFTTGTCLACCIAFILFSLPTVPADFAAF